MAALFRLTKVPVSQPRYAVLGAIPKVARSVASTTIPNSAIPAAILQQARMNHLTKLASELLAIATSITESVAVQPMVERVSEGSMLIAPWASGRISQSGWCKPCGVDPEAWMAIQARRRTIAEAARKREQLTPTKRAGLAHRRSASHDRMNVANSR